MKYFKDLISVVMCTHNTDIDFFSSAIRSVLSQTYDNFELIIVDDCSPNFPSLDFLNDERIRILHNNKNVGPAESRNIGIKASNGKYIAILDSDDLCLKNRLYLQYKFLEKHKKNVACGSWFKFIGEKNHLVKRRILNQEKYKASLFFSNSPTILHSSLMVRRDVLINNNIFYDKFLWLGEDYKLYIDLLEFGKITNINKCLVYYRVCKNQLSSIHRSEHMNDFLWKIMRFQLEKIGIDISEQIEKIARLNYLSTEVQFDDLYSYLNLLIAANKKSKYLSNYYFQKKCKERIKKKIYKIISSNEYINMNNYPLYVKNYVFFAKIRKIIREVVKR